MRIVIDSREQAPFLFEGYGAEVGPGALAAGDYSLCGLESLVAVERKSLADLTMRLGREQGGDLPQGQPQAKKLDAATAKQYLQKAGGDVNKAREMARAEGWSF